MGRNQKLLVSACVMALALLAVGCSSVVAPLTIVHDQALPVPHANNAVASAVDGDGAVVFYSFNGLKTEKTWQATSHKAFACKVGGECRALDDVPVVEGRLASVAVTLGNIIYLFGGYTVAEDNAEVSTPEVFAFDPLTERYTRVADMPTPVDDMVAFTFQERYIYLVSGWHNDGNVSLVQVYDVQTDQWFKATDYPGPPVFGHAGGAVGNKILIADGVAVVGVKDGRRQFGAVDDVWLGEIDNADPAIISWRAVEAHPGRPLYRMAAAGHKESGQVIFVGGGDNPYNYNGIGYDGVPSVPSNGRYAFDFKTESWVDLGTRPIATMDHRGLLFHGQQKCTLGGLDAAQNVIGDLVCSPLTGTE